METTSFAKQICSLTSSLHSSLYLEISFHFSLFITYGSVLRWGAFCLRHEENNGASEGTSQPLTLDSCQPLPRLLSIRKRETRGGEINTSEDPCVCQPRKFTFLPLLQRPVIPALTDNNMHQQMPTKLSGADIQYKAIFSSTKALGILLHNFHCKEVGLILNVLVCFSNSYVSEIDQRLLLKVNTVEILLILGPPMKGRV